MHISRRLFLHAFLASVGVVAYVALVAFIMQNGEKWFGQIDNTLWGPVAILLLFVTSAAVAGSLVFGRPAVLFFSGARQEAVILAVSTIGLLALETLTVFFFVALR